MMQGRVKIALGLGTALLATGALIGCSKGGGGAAQSFNEAPASGAYNVTPGYYETTLRITNFTSQGLPEDATRGIERAKANPITQRACLPIGISLESASLKNLRIAFPQNFGGCNVGEYSFEGGNIRGALSCDIRNIPQGNPQAPRALTIAANVNGSYQGDSTTGTAHLEVTEPGGNRSGTVDIEYSSKRVGDCPAGTDPFGPRPTYSPPPSYPTMNGATTNSVGDMGEMGGNMSSGSMGDGNSAMMGNKM